MKQNIILVIGLFFLILLSSFSLAESWPVSVTDSKLYYGSEELSIIGKNIQYTTSLRFSIQTPYEFETIRADFSAVDLRRTTRYTTPFTITSSCHEKIESVSSINEDGEEIIEEQFVGYDCVYSDLFVFVQDGSITIPLHIKTTNGTDIQENDLTISFGLTLDTTSPVITDIASLYCVQENCYLRNNQANIVLVKYTDAVGTMHQRNVFITTPRTSSIAPIICGEGECRYSLLADCSRSREPIQVSIAAGRSGSSTDDAGNPVTGLMQKNLFCDLNEPGELILPENTKNEGINVTIEKNLVYTPNPVTGETITIKALITEDASGVFAKGNFSELNDVQILQDGVCRMHSTLEKTYECTWQVLLKNAGHHQFQLYFEDGAGRNALDGNGFTVPLLVDQDVVFDSAQGEEVPQFFADVTASLYDVPNFQGINRIAIDLATKNDYSYPIFATIKLNKLSNENLESLHFTISADDQYLCELKHPDGLLSSMNPFKLEFVNPSQSWKDKIRLNIKVDSSTGVNNLPELSYLTCPVSVIVRNVDEGKVYSTPSKFKITVPINFKNSALGNHPPGEKFASKIKEMEEEDREGLRKTIEQVETIFDVLDKICAVKRTLTQTQTGAASLEGIGYGLSLVPVTSGIGLSLEKLGKSIFTGIGKIVGDENLYDNVMKEDGILGTACSWFTCTHGEGISGDLFGDASGFTNSLEQKLMFNGEGLGSALGNEFSSQLVTGIATPNPKNSLVVAMADMCIPAVVYHVKKFQDAKCEQLYCYKQFSKYGLDISTCDAGFSQYLCKSVVGEVFEIVPHTRVLSNLADNANAMLQSMMPTMLKAVVNNYVCKGVVAGAADTPSFTSAVRIFACHLPQSISNLVFLMNKNSHSKGAFQYPQTNSICNYAYANEYSNTVAMQGSQGKTPQRGEVTEEGYAKQQSYFGGILTVDVPQGYEDPVYTSQQVDIVQANALLKTVLDTEKPELQRQQALDRLKESNMETRIADPLSGTKENPNGYLDFYNINAIDLADLSDSTTYSYSDLLGFSQNLDDVIARTGNVDSYIITTDFAKKLSSGLVSEGVKANDDFTQEQIIRKAAQLAYEKDDSKNIEEYEQEFKENLIRNQAQQNQWIAERTTISSQIQNYEYELTELLENPDIHGPEVYAEINKLENELVVLNERLDHASTKLQELESESDFNAELVHQELKQDELQKQFGTIDEAARDSQKAIRARQVQQLSRFVADQVAAQLVRRFSDYMMLSYFDTGTWIGSFSEWTQANLGSEAAIEGVCSASAVAIKSLQEPPGSVVQCVGTSCRPVLSFASEKMQYNETHDLLTIIYYIGDLRPEFGASSTQKIRYNVVFKGPRGSMAYFDTWQELAMGKYHDFTIAEIASRESGYTEMCITFYGLFPPQDTGGKRQYCRPIVDSRIGDSAFDTGSPVPVDYYSSSSNVQTGQDVEDTSFKRNSNWK